MFSEIYPLFRFSMDISTARCLLALVPVLWFRLASAGHFVVEDSRSYSSYCETETFNASCSTDQVILMTHARYGRMRLSRCVRLDYGHIGCSTDVLLAADSRCSGRRTCAIRVPDARFGEKKPCPDDLKPYLEAGYICVKTQTSAQVCPQNSASTSSNFLPVDNPLDGFLTNFPPEVGAPCTSGAITRWTILVQPGQIIRIELYDFGIQTRGQEFKPPKVTKINDDENFRQQDLKQQSAAIVASNIDDVDDVDTDDGDSFTPPLCKGPLYATLLEPEAEPEPLNVSVCGGHLRQVTAYVTTMRRVDVIMYQISETGQRLPHFLLHYQAVGCPELPQMKNAWIVRKEGGLMIRCNYTKHVYHLKCIGNQWIGDMGNCTTVSGEAEVAVNRVQIVNMSISYGTSIAIVLIIALTIGLLVLSSGLLLIRKNRAVCWSQTSRPRADCSDEMSMSGVTNDDVINKGHMTVTRGCLIPMDVKTGTGYGYPWVGNGNVCEYTPGSRVECSPPVDNGRVPRRPPFSPSQQRPRASLESCLRNSWGGETVDVFMNGIQGYNSASAPHNKPDLQLSCGCQVYVENTMSHAARESHVEVNPAQHRYHERKDDCYKSVPYTRAQKYPDSSYKLLLANTEHSHPPPPPYSTFRPLNTSASRQAHSPPMSRSYQGHSQSSSAHDHPVDSVQHRGRKISLSDESSMIHPDQSQPMGAGLSHAQPIGEGLSSHISSEDGAVLHRDEANSCSVDSDLPHRERSSSRVSQLDLRCSEHDEVCRHHAQSFQGLSTGECVTCNDLKSQNSVDILSFSCDDAIKNRIDSNDCGQKYEHHHRNDDKDKAKRCENKHKIIDGFLFDDDVIN